MDKTVWNIVPNITPNSAECPICNKIYVVDDHYWEMWKKSPLTGRVMDPACCPGFWAIWRTGMGDTWEFVVKSRGVYVRRSYGNR